MDRGKVPGLSLLRARWMGARPAMFRAVGVLSFLLAGFNLGSAATAWALWQSGYSTLKPDPLSGAVVFGVLLLVSGAYLLWPRRKQADAEPRSDGPDAEGRA